MPRIAALCIALVILATPLSGCYSFEEESSIRSEDLSISPEVLLGRSEEHTSELQSRTKLVFRLLLEKKKHTHTTT